MLALDVSLHRGALELKAAQAVAAGECLALVGPSGAGKSTVLKIVAGLTRPDDGRVELDGEVWIDREGGGEVPADRRRIGFVFQEYALFPRMSAWRNVAYGIRGAGRGERRLRALATLERFGLADRADARPSELSGGERQRVALARALATDPKLLLLDEPLSALDARTRAAASAELAQLLRSTEIPAVIVTHDFAEAALLSDRVAVLDRGRIVQEGTAAELAATPVSAFVADLTGAVVLRGTARPDAQGLTAVDLDGGGTLSSTDVATGPVAASVFPWEIELGEVEGEPAGSALNHLIADVTGVTEFGNRARVGLAVPQPLAAEVTSASVARLGIRPGGKVSASWKATATRLVSL
ncbi:MAG: ABC transporter ATP-binding protein [Actinomycetota bacterium]|nr:ABC transporter ATP-binding protein [Actinomycetota bacterium]